MLCALGPINGWNIPPTSTSTRRNNNNNNTTEQLQQHVDVVATTTTAANPTDKARTGAAFPAAMVVLMISCTVRLPLCTASRRCAGVVVASSSPPRARCVSRER